MSAGEASREYTGANWRLLVDEDAVAGLAAAIDPRFRALVVLLRHSGLRWCEAIALRRRYCFVHEGSIEVAEEAREDASGIRFRRLRHEGWVSVRDADKDALAEHLARYVPESRSALVFSDFAGAPLRYLWFHTEVWLPALERAGLPADIGVECLQAARLRAWQIEAGMQLAQLRRGGR